MLKKLGLTAFFGVGMLALAHPSNAAVRWGVTVSEPCSPSYTTGYSYNAPVYVAPSYGNTYRDGWRVDRDRHERRERNEHDLRKAYDRRDERGNDWRR